jgi:hypothetical protein
MNDITRVENLEYVLPVEISVGDSSPRPIEAALSACDNSRAGAKKTPHMQAKWVSSAADETMLLSANVTTESSTRLPVPESDVGSKTVGSGRSDASKQHLDWREFL